MFGFEKGVKRCFLLTVDGDLCEKRECDSKFQFAERTNLFVLMVLLFSKLTARESQDNKISMLVLVIETFQVSELCRQLSFGGCIDNEDHLVFKGGHRKFFAGYLFDRNVIDGHELYNLFFR